METAIRLPQSETPRCPHCGSTRTLDVNWDWNGENPDGSIAPRHVVWECLDCAGFFTTME